MAGKDEKNWLIRTKNFQILGPVSKKKVIEFVEKGSLKADDEISCGNGYWFSIGEKDLLEKYIYGDVPQEFNPISEAPTVLATEENLGHTASFGGGGISQATQQANEHSNSENVPEMADQDEDGQKLPGGDDLDYPDFGDDITVVSQPNNLIQKFEEQNQQESSGPPPIQGEFDDSPSNEGDGMVPPEDDLEYPDLPSGGGGVAGPASDAPVVNKENSVESASPEVMKEGEEEVLVPGGEDLEYPDLSSESHEGPPASLPEEKSEKQEEDASEESLELSTEQASQKPEKLAESRQRARKEETASETKQSVARGADITESDELDEVDINLPDAKGEEKEDEITAPDISHKETKKKSKAKKSKTVKKDRNDRYLIYLFILLALLVGGIVYYYLQILNKPLPLVGSAQAQTIEAVGKKKV